MVRIAATALLFVFVLAAPVFAQTVVFDENWGPQGITVLEESESGLLLNFSMHSVSFHSVLINGEPMTAVSMPGSLLGNNEGAPNLPGISRFFAIGQGAGVSFEIIDSRSVSYHDMDIAPASKIPSDNDDTMPVYRKDPMIYLRDADFPASTVQVSEPTNIRGVDAAVIGITPFKHNPVTRELELFSDIRVRVTFSGGNGKIGEDRLRSPHFDPILKNLFINAKILPNIDYSRRTVELQNMASGSRAEEAEYVIIIPNDADYAHWAEVIKEFRTLQGIKTEVYPLTVTGNTANQIRIWIRNAVLNWSMPPVAVLLLGDAPSSGEGTSIPVPYWSSTPSDNVYVDIYGNDELPDLAISRICAGTKGELAEMVMKVIDYESNPPTDPDFYNRPTFAAGWQSDRWFVICSEIVFGYMENVLGMQPNREYAGNSGPPSYWSTNSNTYLLVNYFGPSGLGYIPTIPSHLWDWGGNATRINNDFNSGSFFALHRDHGSSSGWSHPSYQISDLSGLHNNMLPFVLSINCSTGAFAGGSECFAEAMYRMEHGAVGVIAASGTSYSFVNDTYVFGMIDSMFPEFDPGYGGTTGPNILQPAFANMSGKHFLESSNWPNYPSYKDVTYHLFHTHCETFFTMNSEVPQALSVSHASSMPLGAYSFDVTADHGSFIALTVEEQDRTVKIIGTGFGTGFPAEIPVASPQNEARIMTVTVTKPNHYRYSDTVFIPGPGAFTQYGSGLAGTGGYVPDLDGTGIPIFGNNITVEFTNGLGGAGGLVYIGLAQVNLPFMGGNLLALPNIALPITMGGTSGTPGAGSLSLPATPYIADVNVYLQFFLQDGAAPKGVSMSNGLEIEFP